MTKPTLHDRVDTVCAGLENGLYGGVDEVIHDLLFDMLKSMQGGAIAIEGWAPGEGVDVLEALKELCDLTHPCAQPSQTVVRPYLVDSFTGESNKDGSLVQYIVTTVNDRPVACTCPDFHYRHRVCKHMAAFGSTNKGEAI